MSLISQLLSCEPVVPAAVAVQCLLEAADAVHLLLKASQWQIAQLSFEPAVAAAAGALPAIQETMC